MAKSSAGVFRARFVVPFYDWPSFLEDGINEYESVSRTTDQSAGRTRLGAGVLVMELGGSRSRHRLLCVTAQTATVFVHVLHRLLSGLADGERVYARMLVNQPDFESAATVTGRGGIVQAMNVIREQASVSIEEGFEQFVEYPLTGETSIRIIGRSSAVVHCVCLVNQILYEGTTNKAITRLVSANLRLSNVED